MSPSLSRSNPLDCEKHYFHGAKKVFERAKARNLPEGEIVRLAMRYDLESATRQWFRPHHHLPYPGQTTEAVKGRQQIISSATAQANTRSFGTNIFQRAWDNAIYATLPVIAGVFAATGVALGISSFLADAFDAARIGLMMGAFALSIYPYSFFYGMKTLRHATTQSLEEAYKSLGQTQGISTVLESFVDINLNRIVMDERMKSQFVDLFRRLAQSVRTQLEVPQHIHRIDVLLGRVTQESIPLVETQTFADLQGLDQEIRAGRLRGVYAVGSLEQLMGVSRSDSSTVTYSLPDD